jgi:hypothetical protein
MPEMKAAVSAIERYKLATGGFPASKDDLDITLSQNTSFSYDSSNGLAVGSAIGDYLGKVRVWLMLRQGNDFRITCETYASYSQGVKLCEDAGGVRSMCAPAVSQGNGTIYCYTLPMPGVR